MSTLDGQQYQWSADKSTGGQFPKNLLGQKLCIVISVILLYHNGVHKADKINTSQLKSLFRGNGQFEANLTQNCEPYVS